VFLGKKVETTKNVGGSQVTTTSRGWGVAIVPKGVANGTANSVGKMTSTWKVEAKGPDGHKTTTEGTSKVRGKEVHTGWTSQSTSGMSGHGTERSAGGVTHGAFSFHDPSSGKTTSGSTTMGKGETRSVLMSKGPAGVTTTNSTTSTNQAGLTRTTTVSHDSSTGVTTKVGTASHAGGGPSSSSVVTHNAATGVTTRNFTATNKNGRSERSSTHDSTGKATWSTSNPTQ
jgi:hypothetical protein